MVKYTSTETCSLIGSVDVFNFYLLDMAWELKESLFSMKSYYRIIIYLAKIMIASFYATHTHTHTHRQTHTRAHKLV